MNNESLEVLFENVKHNYDTVADADNALDGKAGTLMGIEIAFGIAYLTLFFDSLTCTDFLGLIVMGFSTALLSIVNWPRTYLPVAVDPRRHPEYLLMAKEDLLKQSIVDAQNALDENAKKLGCKASLYQTALVLLIVSAFLLILKI